MKQPTIRFTQFNEEMKESKLGLLVDIFRGASPRPKSDPKYYGGPIPRLMIEDVTRDGKYVTPKIDSLTLEGAKKSRLLEKGSLVLSCSGTRVAIPGILNNDACIHDGFFGFKNYKNIDKEFLYYFFVKLHESIQASATKGATFNNLTTEIMKTMSFIVPSLEEQKEIASFFNLMDQKIRKQQEKIEKLEQFKKGMMQKIFSQELRFKDEDGGDFSEWETRSLIELGEFKRSYSFSRSYEGEGKYLHIHYGDIHTKLNSIIDTDTELPNINVNGDLEELEVGDILFADASEDYKDLGKAVVIINNENKKIVAGLHTHRFRPFSLITPVYLMYFTKTDYYSSFIRMYGTGVSVLGISKTNLGIIDVPVPSVKEQEKIADYLLSIEKKIKKVKEKLLTLEEQKKGFMQGMFV